MDYYVKTEKLEMLIERDKKIREDKTDIRLKSYFEKKQADSEKKKDE